MGIDLTYDILKEVWQEQKEHISYDKFLFIEDGSYCDEDGCIEWGIKPLTRPPQSWCYVEDLN